MKVMKIAGNIINVEYVMFERVLRKYPARWCTNVPRDLATTSPHRHATFQSG